MRATFDAAYDGIQNLFFLGTPTRQTASRFVFESSDGRRVAEFGGSFSFGFGPFPTGVIETLEISLDGERQARFEGLSLSAGSAFAAATSDLLTGGASLEALVTAGDDVARGSRFADAFSGGDGDDRAKGGRGNDSVSGGVGDDTASGGRGADRLEGEDGNDRLSGDADEDVLIGGDGNDHLEGGAGSDVFDGGRGRDTLVVDSDDRGRRAIDGGADFDVLDLSDWRGGLRVTERAARGEVTTKIAQSRPNVTVKAEGVEALIGTDGADVFVLVGARHRVEGGDGRDRVTLKGVGQVALGEDGNDVLIGTGRGGQRFDGGQGRDLIRAGKGNDRIDGGEDADRLEGGGGKDRFRFERGDGRDRILDWEDGRDRIEIESGARGFRALDVEERGRNVTVSFANVTIVINGADEDDISRADFIF